MGRAARKACVVAVFVLLGGGAWGQIDAGPSQCARLAGVVLVVGGSILGGLARHHLGKSFSVRAEAKRLVTDGIYARIPHPLYVFADVALLGVVLLVGWRWLVPVWAVLVVVQAFVAAREARRLEAAFGDAYRDYRRSTWW